MRVEILQELGSDDATLEIPWVSSDARRRSYVDLKITPERVVELDECRRRPDLVSLLRVINRPGSVLRTAKCDVWITHELGEDERWDFDFRVKMASYLDLLFDSRELSSNLAEHLRLAEEIERGLKMTRLQCQMDIAVRRCLFHPEENWGYYLTLFIHAYGGTENEAEKEWALATSTLCEVLEGLSRAPWETETGSAGSPMSTSQDEVLGGPITY